MAVARKPTRPSAATSRPAAVPSPKTAAPAKSPTSVAKLATETGITAMPVQILDAATAQVEDIQEVTRSVILSGAEGVCAAYDRTRIAAEESTGSLEAAIKAASTGLKELQLKAIENIQANTMAAFGLAKDMAANAGHTKASPLSGELLQKHMECFTAQATEFSKLAQKVVTDTMAPISDLMSRAFVVPPARSA